VLKLVGLRGLLRAVPEVPVVVLDAVAYVDWLYPHLAFRPVIDLRIALRGEDGPRFAKAVAGQMSARTEDEGRIAIFTDGRITLTAQEGLWPGGPGDEALFARRVAYRALSPSAARPSPEDALLATVADQALQGLLAPLITFVDLRELLRLPLDVPYLRSRAQETRLARALRGAMLLVAHFFPDVGPAAASVCPELTAPERVAVDRVVETASDPARFTHLRGAEAAARLVVAP